MTKVERDLIQVSGMLKEMSDTFLGCANDEDFGRIFGEQFLLRVQRLGGAHRETLGQRLQQIREDLAKITRHMVTQQLSKQGSAAATAWAAVEHLETTAVPFNDIDSLNWDATE